MEIDLKKLLKLLSLSQSSNDHEALSAIRKANKMLEAFNKEWSDLLYNYLSGYKSLSVPRSSFSNDVSDQLKFLMDKLDDMPQFDRQFVEGLSDFIKNGGKPTKANKKRLTTLYTFHYHITFSN